MTDRKDKTIYSQSEHDKTSPRSYSIKNGDITINVHKYIGCGETWFVSCYELKIVTIELKSTDIESAKLEAIEIVLDRTRKLAEWTQEMFVKSLRQEIQRQKEKVENGD